MSVSEDETQGERVRTLFDELGGIERELWLLVVAMVLADVWLTRVGIQTGLREGNPAVRLLIEMFGFGALAAVKGGVVGVAGVIADSVPPWQAPAVPLGLALPWFGGVVVNVCLLVVA